MWFSDVRSGEDGVVYLSKPCRLLCRKRASMSSLLGFAILFVVGRGRRKKLGIERLYDSRS
jgi:hypothetical protein